MRHRKKGNNVGDVMELEERLLLASTGPGLHLVVDGPDSAQVGEVVEFKLTGENRGQEVAGATVIADHYPEGLSPRNLPPGCSVVLKSEAPGEYVHCIVGDLQPGEKVTRTLTFVVTDDTNCGGTIRNLVDLQAQGGFFDWQHKDVRIDCGTSDVCEVPAHDSQKLGFMLKLREGGKTFVVKNLKRDRLEIKIHGTDLKVNGHLFVNALRGCHGLDVWGMQKDETLWIAMFKPQIKVLRANGEAGNDKVRVYSDTQIKKIVLIGGAGHDKLIGSAQKEILLGRDGNDRLIGRGGNDKLKGGNGNDTLNGGPGRDKLIGGAGRDRFILDPNLVDRVLDEEDEDTTILR